MKSKKVIDGIKKKLWKMINDIDYSVEDYEYRGDEGDYTPSEQEEELINDYTQGFLEEIVNTLTTKYKELGLFTLDDIEIDRDKIVTEIFNYMGQGIDSNGVDELASTIADKKPIKIKE